MTQQSIKITDEIVLSILRENVKIMEELWEKDKQFQAEIEAFEEKKVAFKNAMHKAYGVGNWEEVNAKEETYLPRSPQYIVKNPDLIEKVQLPEDVTITTKTVEQSNEQETSGIPESSTENS